MRHRAEVIEVYPDEGKAALRFQCRGKERVECVPLYQGPDAVALSVGDKGWATYTMSNRCGFWGFATYKGGDK